MKLKPIAEQVIVITGASSGIGLATAQLASEMGAKLVLTARSGDTLDGICADLNASGGSVIAIEADVAVREQVDQVARIAIAEFSRIDTWVNNAGVAIYGMLEEVTEADSRRLFDTNFWGVVNGSLAALPYIRQAGGGALINIGGEVSDAVAPLQGMNTASKYAVKGFTDALRVEAEQVDRAPISITLVQPAAVDTPYPQHARNYMDREPKLPAPQIQPEQVARAILDAAINPTRDVKVGAMATLNALAARLSPALADRLSPGQIARQQYSEPPRNPEGGLWHGVGKGQVHGSGGYEAQTY